MFKYTEYETYPIPPILLQHCTVERVVPKTLGELLLSYKQALICTEQGNDDKDKIGELTNDF